MLSRTAATPGRRSGGIQKIFVPADVTHSPVSSREYKEFVRSCSADDSFEGGTPVVIWSEPILRRKPSGVKDTLSYSPRLKMRELLVLIFHRQTVLSNDRDATSCPSGEKTTALTESRWAWSDAWAWPVLASHNRTVRSSDPDATSCPSGEKTTMLTQLE